MARGSAFLSVGGVGVRAPSGVAGAGLSGSSGGVSGRPRSSPVRALLSTARAVGDAVSGSGHVTGRDERAPRRSRHREVALGAVLGVADPDELGGSAYFDTRSALTRAVAGLAPGESVGVGGEHVASKSARIIFRDAAGDSAIALR